MLATRVALLLSGRRPRRYELDNPSSNVITSSSRVAISSGFFRAADDTDGSGSRIRIDSACSPRRPAATPNSTRWPGFREETSSGSAEEWTKTSSPSSRERKPKPFSTSYHFTLPVGTLTSFCSDRHWVTAPSLRERYRRGHAP